MLTTFSCSRQSAASIWILQSILCLSLVTWGLSPSYTTAQSKMPLEQARQRMVEEDIIGGGVKNPRVIQTMRDTPRHEFVPLQSRQNAYYDMSLPIGEQQTISGPFVVAYMTEQLDPQLTDRVLEIGTGSGYQAAVLSPLVKDVYTIEILEPLGKRAEQTLKRLKYENVHVKIGDGYQGWPEHAPFDKIIVTCSPEKVPQPLVEQLKEGGKMIIPVGERFEQMLYRYTKKNGQLVAEPLRPTLFVPMTGTAEAGREVQPDPLRPQIVHGGFEEPVGDDGEPRGWYYCRLMKVVEANDAPEGKRYITFTNDVPGRTSRALQGFAVDGKKIGQLEVSAMIRGRDIKAGPTVDQLPQISLTYYDDNWAIIGRNFSGPYRGTFDWQRVTDKLPVPAKASKCIMHIGLLGAVGEFSVDDVSVRPIAR
ncbi:MAG TPA: protein-L-isoaspartate(D-aspartate) O-methyltransferase [Pirellulales bacterium]|nr:protein-L-isoaspartate(D-aspartate) O-methyltransferase [Pirellulales bacterium]